MHIALHHDAIIPPKKYGGTERIIYWLAKGLMALGQKVTLVAREGSHVEGTRFFSVQGSLPTDIDVIHFSATPHFAPGKSPARPFLVTIHGNGRPGERFLPNTVFLSARHAANHGSSLYVYNGIDPDEYPCDSRRDDSLVFLAKASWKVKNLVGAIELARAAGLPLKVMGNRGLPFGLHKMLPAYRGVKYLGMVDDQEKKKHLRNARALLFPVRWHEPFGLAVTEALASGCVVIGTPYGSLPELIDSSCGFLSSDASELLKTIRQSTYSPSACRNRVLRGLTHLDMAKSYLALYERLLRGEQISEPTMSGFEKPPETLLEYRFLGF